MDNQVYLVVKKVHDLLTKTKGQAEHLTDADIAYINGLLESILTLCSEPQAGTPQPEPGFINRMVHKITPNERL